VTYLQDSGYHNFVLAELVDASDGLVSLPRRPVIVTIDDEWDENYQIPYPNLQEHGMSAEFFVSTNWMENPEGTLSWAQIEEMSRGGMEFGSHSAARPYLTTSEPRLQGLGLTEVKAAL
jgi:peptidoglycan/xylan/chitin deacetylase (PgdA/CDA1 family)